jgi:hypothetical protein
VVISFDVRLEYILARPLDIPFDVMGVAWIIKFKFSFIFKTKNSRYVL